MSQDPLPRDTTHDARFLEHLRRKGISANCPACGSADQMLDEARGVRALIPYAGRTIHQPSNFMSEFFPAAELSVYVFKCNNCGHVRLFDRAIGDAST